MFRIYPGPGNYVTVGNKATALRKVPASATPAVSGDGSFWGQYMADPGDVQQGHARGGWNPDTWNSARCDTAEVNIFPVDGRASNLPGIQPDCWMSTIHEDGSGEVRDAGHPQEPLLPDRHAGLRGQFRQHHLRHRAGVADDRPAGAHGL